MISNCERDKNWSQLTGRGVDVAGKADATVKVPLLFDSSDRGDPVYRVAGMLEGYEQAGPG
jgi:hypothetical protein